METTEKTTITVETVIKAPIEKVWKLWTDPAHITHWYNASDNWHAPYADNDLQLGKKFKTTMAAKDGSVSFDFEGVYTTIQEYSVIAYTIMDGRKVKIVFSEMDDKTRVVETFEAENINTVEMQRDGWQNILDNFKKYAEANQNKIF